MTRSTREPSNEPLLETYRWVVEGAGRDPLASIHSEEIATHELIRRLRKRHSESETRVLVEQREMRQRALIKFPRAHEMFFTRRGLEQASDWRIAAYKSKRFAAQTQIVDACCGVGGDLMALSNRGPVLGIDRDPLLCYLASANLRAIGASDYEIRCEDLERCHLPGDAVVHIDPDRRAHERRSTRLSLHEPSEATLSQLTATQPGVAVKLSPATEPEERLLFDAKLEWIGHSNQCQQLVAWFGSLCGSQAARTATILLGERSESWSGEHETPLVPSEQPEGFLYEPHPTLLAAGLAGAWAASQHLRSLTPGGGYLTGTFRELTPWAQTFELLDWMPFRLQKIRAWLRERNVGRVEVKKRNVDIDPAKLQRDLEATGEETAVVVLTRVGPRVIAMLCRRCAHTTENQSGQATSS